jgi:membrane associated rhomboid family serine protease
VIPLKDTNPTYHRAIATIVLIMLNLGVFVLIQDRGSDRVSVETPAGAEVGIPSGDRFSLRYAAIPCELTQGRALDFNEVRELFRGESDSCDAEDGPQLFPAKSVWLAVLTSMFLHADLVHLGFNMWFLWLFGNNIEDHVGPVKYIGFYLLAGIAAMSAHVALQPGSVIPVIGASGAIAGVMGAYMIWFPRAPIRTLVFVFVPQIRAVWVLLAWFVLQFFVGTRSQVAWAAHVGGFAFGVFCAVLVRQIRPLCRLVWREPWRSQAYYRWDLTGGTAMTYRPPPKRSPRRLGRRRW